MNKLKGGAFFVRPSYSFLNRAIATDTIKSVYYFPIFSYLRTDDPRAGIVGKVFSLSTPGYFTARGEEGQCQQGKIKIFYAVCVKKKIYI